MNKEGCKGVIKSRMRVLTLYRMNEKEEKEKGEKGEEGMGLKVEERK